MKQIIALISTNKMILSKARSRKEIIEGRLEFDIRALHFTVFLPIIFANLAFEIVCEMKRGYFEQESETRKHPLHNQSLTSWNGSCCEITNCSEIQTQNKRNENAREKNA